MCDDNEEKSILPLMGLQKIIFIQEVTKWGSILNDKQPRQKSKPMLKYKTQLKSGIKEGIYGYKYQSEFK